MPLECRVNTPKMDYYSKLTLSFEGKPIEYCREDTKNDAHYNNKFE